MMSGEDVGNVTKARSNFRHGNPRYGHGKVSRVRGKSGSDSVGAVVRQSLRLATRRSEEEFWLEHNIPKDLMEVLQVESKVHGRLQSLRRRHRSEEESLLKENGEEALKLQTSVDALEDMVTYGSVDALEDMGTCGVADSELEAFDMDAVPSENMASDENVLSNDDCPPVVIKRRLSESLEDVSCRPSRGRLRLCIRRMPIPTMDIDDKWNNSPGHQQADRPVQTSGLPTEACNTNRARSAAPATPSDEVPPSAALSTHALTSRAERRRKAPPFDLTAWQSPPPKRQASLNARATMLIQHNDSIRQPMSCKHSVRDRLLRDKGNAEEKNSQTLPKRKACKGGTKRSGALVSEENTVPECTEGETKTDLIALDGHAHEAAVGENTSSTDSDCAARKQKKSCNFSRRKKQGEDEFCQTNLVSSGLKSLPEECGEVSREQVEQDSAGCESAHSDTVGQPDVDTCEVVDDSDLCKVMFTPPRTPPSTSSERVPVLTGAPPHCLTANSAALADNDFNDCLIDMQDTEAVTVEIEDGGEDESDVEDDEDDDGEEYVPDEAENYDDDEDEEVEVEVEVEKEDEEEKEGNSVALSKEHVTTLSSVLSPDSFDRKEENGNDSQATKEEDASVCCREGEVQSANYTEQTAAKEESGISSELVAEKCAQTKRMEHQTGIDTSDDKTAAGQDSRKSAHEFVASLLVNSREKKAKTIESNEKSNANSENVIKIDRSQVLNGIMQLSRELHLKNGQSASVEERNGHDVADCDVRCEDEKTSGESEEIVLESSEGDASDCAVSSHEVRPDSSSTSNPNVGKIPVSESGPEAMADTATKSTPLQLVESVHRHGNVRSPASLRKPTCWVGQELRRTEQQPSGRMRSFFKEVVNVSDGRKCSVGNAVQLASGQRKVRPYIARVLSIWQERGEVMLRVKWYYRPENLPARVRRGKTFMPQELVASRHIDDNSSACLLGVAHVATVAAYRAYSHDNLMDGSEEAATLHDLDQTIPPDTDPNTVFFCNRWFNHEKDTLL